MTYLGYMRPTDRPRIYKATGGASLACTFRDNRPSIFQR